MPKSKTQTKEAEPVKVEKKTKKTETVAQAKPAKAQKAQTAPKEKKSKRSFKAIYVNPAGVVVKEGRYCGAKPKQAGCKALTGIYKLFAKSKKQLKGPIYFGVSETTRGSRNKTYYYSGERVVLDQPIELQIGGGNGSEAKTITYKFNSNVKKASEEDCEHLANPVEIPEEEPKELPKEAGKKATKKAEKTEKTETKVEVKSETKTETKASKSDKKKNAKK